MITDLKDPNKLLYHYTKASTALEKIIKPRKLKIGCFTSTNDPKETKQWEFYLTTNEARDLDKYKMGELSKKLSNELKEKTKVICFSKDRAPLSGNQLSDIFNRGFCKPRMWAQYAENHTGVCLIFEKDKLNEILSKKFGTTYLLIPGDVTYVDRSVVRNLAEGDYAINVDYLEEQGFEAYSRAHFDRFYKRLFFEKMIDWSNEDEFRWIFLTHTKDDLFFDYGDSLKGIVFGENTKECVINEMINITNYEVKYTGIKWKNCSPWYDFSNFLYNKKLRDSPWFKKNKIDV